MELIVADIFYFLYLVFTESSVSTLESPAKEVSTSKETTPVAQNAAQVLMLYKGCSFQIEGKYPFT